MSVHKLDTQMYVGQKAFINKAGKVLVLRDPRYSVDGQSGLDFPGGKYRWGESLEEELQREVTEETGLRIKIGRPFATWTNDSHHETYEGQTNVYCVGYLCNYLSGEIKLSDEHTGFEWVDKNSYKKWKENTGYFKALEEYFNRFSFNAGT